MSDAVTKNEGRIHLRFLHCGDIHLDTPFAGLPAEKSAERRRLLRESFQKLSSYIRERGVNVALFSGDLFDAAFATGGTAEFLINEFKSCKDTIFIIAPGKADAYDNNPIYTSGRLPENCYVFSEETLSRFDFEKFNVTVYGWANRTGEIAESPLADRKVDDTSRVNIVCGAADIGGDRSKGCAITVNEMKKFGADYYALGSRHESGEFKKLGDSIYSYCGSLECTGFDEPGIGGTNLIVVDYESGELSIDVKKVSFGSMRFRTETIDITGVDTPSEIINRISRTISSKRLGVETALRVILEGSVDPAFQIPKNFESDSFGLYYFELVDKTLPLYGTEHFKRDMSAKGELYRTLLPMLSSEDEDERLIAARAFRSGLAALEGREIE